MKSSVSKLLVCTIWILWVYALQGAADYESNGNVLIGPWGGPGGAPWTYKGKGKISRILVTYDADTIHSIKFTSVDKNGKPDSSPVFGGTKGTQSQEIVFDTEVDELEIIDGLVGFYYAQRTVTSLTFTTRKNKKYGPFGSTSGIAFTLRLTNDSFTGFYGSSFELLNSIGVSIPFKTEETLGPSGSAGGGSWSYLAKGVITHITVYYNNDVLRSLQFTSKTAAGNVDISNVIGTSDQGRKEEIDINPNSEKLIGVLGTTGMHGGANLVTSVTFILNNNKSFGPFGGKGDAPFSYLVKGDEVLTGFHGTAGSLINSIGIYKLGVNRLSSVSIGPTFGSALEQGTQFSYEPTGSITRINITSITAFNTVMFEGLDKNGKPENSPTFGPQTGAQRDVINLGPDEKIIGISGFINNYAQNRIIAAMTFYTNKNKIYGPYGAPQGTEFSFLLKDGYISGFYGYYVGTIHAIGVYIKPF